MPLTTSSVLTIGDELLNGDVVNTNASWLAGKLSLAGIPCRTLLSVPDEASRILEALHYLWQQHDLILLTGGLGPTHDDVTKKAILDFFQDTVVRNPAVYEHIKKYYHDRGREINDITAQQADIPLSATILFNDTGTAPGLLFEKKGKWVVILPGVPYELYHITEQHLLPRIKQHLLHTSKKNLTAYFRTTGIGESDLGTGILKDLDTFITPSVKVAFLPHPLGVDIRVTQIENDGKAAFDRLTQWIRTTAALYIFSEDYQESLSQHLVTLLSQKKKTVAFAESCTGGFLANALTDIPGSSEALKGSIVAYHNEVKSRILRVPPDIIREEGAVSAPVALAMAEQIAFLMNADYGISTTGIAGPGGATPGKPVGTVWIGFYSKESPPFACQFFFTEKRLVNKKRTFATAMEILRRKMLKLPGLPGQPKIVVP